MKNSKTLFDDLKKEVIEIHDNYPHLDLDDCFVGWFLRAFISDNEEEAIKSIVGNAGDKSVDAVYIDHNSRNIFIVQGKYHQNMEVNEKRSDILALADVGRSILLENKISFNSILEKANEQVKESLKKVRQLVQSRNYKLILQFVTTGKISKTHSDEAEARVDDWDYSRFESYSRSDLLKLMQDYLEGAAPPTPTIHIPVSNDEVLKRHDLKTNITTWLFTLEGNSLASIYNSVGLRLFARNIRGYLGNTDINRGMKNTIEKEPDYFWYYNNGITIVCDEAKKITKRNSDVIKVSNAQIINGQQTTRTLAEISDNKAKVLVKLIEMPRTSELSQKKYKQIIGEIVSATNWQNAIMQSDLKSNDEEQVRVERECKKYGYFYFRKRMKKSEAYKYGAKQYHHLIKKEDLIRYLAAARMDPYLVRLGKDRLFEDDIYFKLFDGRHVSEYLTIYWLGRTVDYWAKTNSAYRYEKWPTINFIWKLLEGNFKNITVKEKFRIAMERDSKYYRELKPLDEFVKKSFTVVNKYYKANKKVDGKIQLPIDFFHHSDVYKEIEKYFVKHCSDDRKKLYKLSERLFTNINEMNNR